MILTFSLLMEPVFEHGTRFSPTSTGRSFDMFSTGGNKNELLTNDSLKIGGVEHFSQIFVFG